jgi:Tfp pilus assembly protein PilN
MTACSPYDEINFLPDWYVRARRRRIHRDRMITIAVTMAIVMGTVMALTWSQRQQLELYHESLQQQIAAAEGQLTEVSKLKNAREQLRRQVQVYRQLARNIDVRDINAAITALTPDAVCLTRLNMQSEMRRRRRPDPAKSRAEGRTVYVNEKYEVYDIRLEGVAPSDVEIANYVGRLAASGLFRNVQMAHSRQGRIGKALTRRFLIHCTVPLDRRYRVIADAQEVADAR